MPNVQKFYKDKYIIFFTRIREQLTSFRLSFTVLLLIKTRQIPGQRKTFGHAIKNVILISSIICQQGYEYDNSNCANPTKSYIALTYQ